MAIMTLTKHEVKETIGNLSDEEIDYKLNMAELGVERITENEIEIEITPNRPDLLSKPGLIRYLEAYFRKPGLKNYKINKPEKNYKVIIDKSVKQVRPFTRCAIVRGMNFNDEKIKEIIDIQEKLHGGYGRNRKKLAIGIYPLETIKLPIKYLGLPPEEIKFQPLEFPKEINGRQILSQHPTGREYGNLLKDSEVFPVFQDANKEILSMPPIINSNKTGKITEKTKEIFIECSGFNPQYLQKTLNMIMTALADMGGKIYAMEIHDKKKTISPDLEPEEFPFSIENINKLLGLNLPEKEIKKLLAKMGIGFKKSKKTLALVPAYRTDIIHEVDLAEEIAIAYGYDKFVPEIPDISTIGEENPMVVLKRKITEILTGLQLIEISSYHLSTKEKQFKKIGFKEYLDKVIEIEDSKTENNILRTYLLANSIQVLSENSDAQYPQKIFELGRVFYSDEEAETGIGEDENLCISLCHEKADFTEIKQILDYLMRMLNKEYEIIETEHPAFIKGRCGEIILKNIQKPIGILGEIHPNYLKNNKIKMPISSLEINISDL
ncbi:phenylalanine--tRNA ligase subunit beta [Candidatus Pacearchaeota archaeon]|nr:phenylalanine--tRNA ligase subunit beta [Candidatus Pacearchaeota archaeon]MBD3283179.1 phenylalanine--tRNA ligase subunit beta [Candidatus Pacearchaeota archaeon]